MIHDQADELRQLVRHAAHAPGVTGPAPQMVAVSGARLGVGATTLAVNLAVALARQGRRALLVDADLDRGEAAALCGIRERGSIVDVLAGRRSVHEVLQRGPAGVQVLPGAWAPDAVENCAAAAQQRLVNEIKGLGLHTDVVIVDTGSGRNHFVRRFWQAADVPLIVTTPESSAIMDAYALIKVVLAGDTSMVVRTFVNQSPDEGTAADVHARIGAACRRFLGVRTAAAGYLFEDPHLRDAAQSGMPFVLASPRSETARVVERLADELWEQHHSVNRSSVDRSSEDRNAARRRAPARLAAS